MTNLYLQLKRKHEKQVNKFPMVFAFNNAQFNEGLKKLGLNVGDNDKVVSIGAGGYIHKNDVDAFNQMFKQQDEEMQQAMNNEENGDQFIYDMFNYELANHEYCITYEVDDTLAALGLTIEQIEADERLLNGLRSAIKNQNEEW